MGTDDSTTLSQAKDLVRTFCEERDWDQFHNPKDLAIGISTEASELLEIFRFLTPEQVYGIMNDPKHSEHIREELADVLYFVLRFAQMNDIDLTDALTDKISKNAEKYPVDRSKGRNLKCDDL